MELLVKNQHKIGTAQKQKANKHRRMNKHILEIEAKNLNLREHIEFAIDDLPHCPNSAKDFLTHALTGK